jgi:hypothetical protein
MFFTVTSIISVFAISFIPDSAISFEKGIQEWVYNINMPLGIGSAFIGVNGRISRNLLHFIPLDYINVHGAIICDIIVSKILTFIIVVIGLRKLYQLMTDILNEESPFQPKYVKSLRKLSYAILLYSTLGNTLLCILLSVFASHSFVVTFDFEWTGVLFGIMGYILSDITEYGLFLQDEYDATL